MSGIKAKVDAFLNTFLSHPACLSNTVILAITTGFEQAWESVALKCPEKPPNADFYSSNQLYSVVFILAPALALWMIGILGSNVAWRLCQGLSSRKQPHECSWNNISAIALRTVLVPLVWVFVALMDGDFFACYNYLPSCSEGSSPPVVDGVNCTNNQTAWNYEKKFQSQLIGWVCLLVCLVFGSCVVFCGRRRSKRTYFLNLYSNNLRKQERTQIEKLLKEQAEKDGKRNAGAFIMKFASDQPVSASDWESITREDTKEECEVVTKSETDKEQQAASGQTSTGQEQQDETKELLYHSPLSEFLKDEANENILKDFQAKIDAEQLKQTNNQTQPNQTNN